MKHRNSYTIELEVPDTFNAITIAKKHRDRIRDQRILADRLNWFVSLLVVLPTRQDVRKELEDRGYIALQHKKFLSVFRSDAVTNEVITILVKKEKVVESDGSHRSGYYSTGYRLHGKLLTGKTKNEPLLSREMRDYVSAYWKKAQQDNKELFRPIRFLIPFINDPAITVDLQAAHHFVEHWGYQLTQKILQAQEVNGARLTAELINRAYTKVYYAKRLLRAINHPHTKKFRYHKRDKKGLRLHSTFTGLKSPLRHFLRYGNKHLVSIDIKSSQPFMFTRLLDRDFWEKKSNKVNLYKIHPDLFERLSDDDVVSSIIMSTSSSIITSGSGICGFAYQQIPWGGDYYTMLMKQVGEDFRGDNQVKSCYSTRARTKYHSMLLFFEPWIRTFAYTKPFATYFPGVYRLMNHVRKSSGLKYTSEADANDRNTTKNNNLPIILQRLESAVVLEKICKRIYERNPGVFMLTIHDSIITTTDHSNYVKEIMETVLNEEIGSTPGLKVEPLDHRCVMDGFDEFIDTEWIEMMNAVKKRRKKSKALSPEYIQQLLDNFKTMSQQPLIQNVLPRLKDGRKILSVRYVSGVGEDAQFDGS